MGIFRFFSSVWRKILWVAKLVYAYVGPVYKDVVDLIKVVKSEGLEGDAARREVARRLGSILEEKGISIPNSIINAIIEVVFQLVKNRRE